MSTKILVVSNFLLFTIKFDFSMPHLHVSPWELPQSVQFHFIRIIRGSAPLDNLHF